MTRLVRATELMGLPVVTLDTAAAVGEVRDVLFDPAAFASCGAFTVRGRGLLSPPLLGLLPTGSVALDRPRRGDDRHGRLAARSTSERNVVAVDDQIEVLGKEVVTDTVARRSAA